jgi:hypothetical protein
VWVAAPGRSAEEAIRIAEEGKDPSKATSHLMEAASNAANAPMSGWTLHTFSLEEIDFPPEIVTTPQLAVVVAVASHKEDEEPWGGFVAMLVLPDPAYVKQN